jgi:hypothetical protein
VVNIGLSRQGIGGKGVSALADALKVNTSVTEMDLYDTLVGNSELIDDLLARNKRLRPFILFISEPNGIVAPDNIETLRAEFAVVVEERQRRELCRPVLVADVRALQRETSNQIAEQSNQIAALSDIVSEQASQNAEQTIQIAEQTSQIADLQRSTQLLVEQNQQMQEQMRQVHALLLTRAGMQSADIDVRAITLMVKRRRTNR